MISMELVNLLVLFCVIRSAYCYKILGFFPYPTTSHHNAFRPILLELAKRGHKVVYMTPSKPKETHPNLDVRLMRDFRAHYLDKLDVIALGLSSIPMMSHSLSSTTVEMADSFFGDPAAQEIIHSAESFDAVLMESYFVQEPVSALIHKFGCVAVEISTLGDSAWINELSGLPSNSAYQIDLKTTMSDDMSLTERFYNFYVTWSTVVVSYYHLWNMQKVMDRYFNYTGWETRPPLSKLVSNRSMILINREVVLDYPYPKSPHVQDVGGINIVPNKPLPKVIQKYMDNAANGVIYFSLGSNLNTSGIVTGKFGEAFFNVLGKVPQKVLMKWETDHDAKFPRNIMTSKWMPQQDILAHKNCKLFITHGGFNSLAESVYHGVPLLGIPFFGDQPKNLKQVETAGYGLQLSFQNVSVESVTWAIKELLNNPKYKEEALKRSKRMREEPIPAVERAANWVEYAIKYPNALTPRSAYLSFIELHMIDLYIFSIIFIYLFFKITSIIMSLLSKSRHNKKLKSL